MGQGAQIIIGTDTRTALRMRRLMALYYRGGWCTRGPQPGYGYRFLHRTERLGGASRPLWWIAAREKFARRNAPEIPNPPSSFRSEGWA